MGTIAKQAKLVRRFEGFCLDATEWSSPIGSGLLHFGPRVRSPTQRVFLNTQTSRTGQRGYNDLITHTSKLLRQGWGLFNRLFTGPYLRGRASSDESTPGGRRSSDIGPNRMKHPCLLPLLHHQTSRETITPACAIFQGNGGFNKWRSTCASISMTLDWSWKRYSDALSLASVRCSAPLRNPTDDHVRNCIRWRGR